MKVGDLVRFDFQQSRWLRGKSIDVGLVVETGKYTGNCDVKVLWKGKVEAVTQKSQHLALLTSS